MLSPSPVIWCSNALQQTNQFDYRSPQSIRMTVVRVLVTHENENEYLYACSCMTQLLPYPHAQPTCSSICISLPLTKSSTNPRTRDKAFRFRTRRLSIKLWIWSITARPSLVPTIRGRPYHSHSGTARIPMYSRPISKPLFFGHAG
jgi:hypothetical protein